MNVLLDTHIWIWHLIGARELSAGYKAIIQDESNEIYLSPISVWETHLLIERKRLPVSMKAPEWVAAALEAMQIRDAGLSFAIARRARELDLHPDPADRFIAATALEFNLALLTADKRLRKCKELKIL